MLLERYIKRCQQFGRAEGLKDNTAFLFMPLITLKLQGHFSTNLYLAFNAFKYRAQPVFREDNKQSQMLVLGNCLKAFVQSRFLRL